MKINLLVFALLLAGIGIVWKSQHRAPRVQTTDLASTTADEPSPDERTASAGTEHAAAITSEPSTSVASAPLPEPPAAAPAKIVRTSRFTNDPKVRLDIARLLKSQAFRDLNPDLTLESFLGGNLALENIKLPAGEKLSYELDPSCNQQPKEVTIGQRQLAQLSTGTPVFLRADQKSEESLQSLSDRMAGDPCIKGLALESAGSAADAARGVSSVDPAAASAERQKADQAIADALAKGDDPKFAVIGTKNDLREADPSLLNRAGGRRYQSTPGTYTLGAGDGSASGDAQTAVDVSRQAYTIRSPNGDISASRLSSLIISAVNGGSHVIDIMIPGFDPENFQSAIDYARLHGTIVVNHVPVPGGNAPVR